MRSSISVIIPVYNVEKYLVACLESIVNQTIQFDEVVIIDDGSTDGSSQICDQYRSKYKNVIVIHKSNGGLSDARNAGIKECSSEYILLVDSDDTIDLDTCERFLQHIIGSPDLVVGNLRIVSDNESIKKPHQLCNGIPVSGKDYLKNEYKSKTMHMASVQCLYRKDFLVSNGLCFTKGLVHEDELFTPIVFSKASKVIPTDIEFYNHIMRENSITTRKNKSSNAKSIVQICYLLEEYFDTQEDEELKDLVLEHCVDLYFKVFVDADLRGKREMWIQMDYLYQHSKKKKNKYRTLIYHLSPNLLYVFEKIRRKI